MAEFSYEDDYHGNGRPSHHYDPPHVGFEDDSILEGFEGLDLSPKTGRERWEPQEKKTRMVVHMGSSVRDLLDGKAMLKKTIDLKNVPIGSKTRVYMVPLRVDSPVTLGVQTHGHGASDGPVHTPSNRRVHGVIFPSMNQQPILLGDMSHLNDYDRAKRATGSLQKLPTKSSRDVDLQSVWGMRVRDLEEPPESDASARALALRAALKVSDLPGDRVMVGASHPVLKVLKDHEYEAFGDYDDEEPQAYTLSKKNYEEAHSDLKTIVDALSPHYDKSITISLSPAFQDDSRSFSDDDPQQWHHVKQDIAAHYADRGYNPETAYPDDHIRTAFELLFDHSEDK